MKHLWWRSSRSLHTAWERDCLLGLQRLPEECFLESVVYLVHPEIQTHFSIDKDEIKALYCPNAESLSLQPLGTPTDMYSEVLNQYFLFLSGTLSALPCVPGSHNSPPWNAAISMGFWQLWPCEAPSVLIIICSSIQLLCDLGSLKDRASSTPKPGQRSHGSVVGKQGYPGLLRLILVVLGRRKG